MHKQDRPMIVVLQRSHNMGTGPIGLLSALELRHMSWLEWTLYRLKTALQRSKPRINVSPPDFPANNIGVWLDAHQYNVLVGKDPDAVPVKSTIPKEMVFMPPDVSEACDEGYAV